MPRPKKTKKKVGPKVGRPTKLKPEMFKQIETLIASGWTQAKCRTFFGVSKATWYRWKDQNQEFRDLLDNALDGNVAKVEDALFRRALGYKAKEEAKTTQEDENGIKTVRRRTTKDVAPDTNAIKFYLTNRARSRWKTQPEEEGAVDLNLNVKWADDDDG